MSKEKGDQDAPSQNVGGKSPVVPPNNSNQGQSEQNQNPFDASARGNTYRGRNNRRGGRFNYRSRGGSRFQKGTGRGTDFQK